MVRHFLAYVHSPQPLNQVRVPLSWSFNQAFNLFTIGLWFQFTLLDFWLKAPFTLLKSYPTLEQPLKWYPSLEKIPFKDLQIKRSLKNPSTRTLSSNDTKETIIEWCTKAYASGNLMHNERNESFLIKNR